MRNSIVAVAILIAAVIFAMPALAATAKEAPTDAVLDQCAAKKAGVNFPHGAHLELTECTTCHHTNEGLTADSDQEVAPCVSCHKEPEAAETPDCAQMSMSKNPYHITCVTCHKESGSENAPTKCDGCHPTAE
jgi:hypothetical protein